MSAVEDNETSPRLESILTHGGLLRRRSGEACRLRSSRVARYLHNASIPTVIRKNAGEVTS